MAELNEERIALIPTLAGRSPQGHIGRTAVVKFLYFLQALRDVPLGYRFTLHSYGPFDSDVLADLATAEALGLVESTVVQFPGGYGYEIRPGRHTEWLQKRSAQFLKRYEPEVNWVIQEFGKLGSGDLELVSTIVYVDQEAASNDEELSLEKIAEIVKGIKPHFSSDKIMEFAVWLEGKDLLGAAA